MAKRKVRWLLAAPLLVLGLAVVGTWVYIQFLRPEPAARLSLSDQTVAPGQQQRGSAPTEFSGTWNVAPGSAAGYRVKEILFGQEAVAVGRTENVKGSFRIDGSRVSTGSFTVDMASVTSDQTRRDNQFRTRIMDVATHPTSTFQLTQPIELPAAPVDGGALTVRATGDLTLRGTTKRLTVLLDTKRLADRVEVAGRVPIVFEEWGIPNPSFGPAQTEDRGELEFLLVFTRSG